MTPPSPRRWWRRNHETSAPAPVRAEAAASTESWVRPAGLQGGEQPLMTPIGTLDGPGSATVDGRGLVSPAGATWSLDWWVGADDRWHLPSQEVAVRQTLLQHAPVVETSMRIPGGDAVQRAYAVQLPGGHVIVVEVENQSSMPFALAWAVRPFTAGAVGRIGGAAIDGTVVSVDGAPAVVLDRAAGRAATAVCAAGDVARQVFAGGAEEEAPSADCPDGLAQAVAIVAVPHRATVRAILPVAVEEPIQPTFPSVLPAAGDVAGGWAAHIDNGVRLLLPEGPVADAAERARRWLLLGATEGGASPALLGRGEPLLTLVVADTLGELGHSHEAARLVASWLVAEPAGVGAIAPSLVALARHWRRTGDIELVRAAREQVRDGAAVVADRIGRGEPSAALACWAVAGLHAAAELLDANDDRRAAGDAHDAAKRSIDRRDQLLADAPLDPGGDIDVAAAVLRAAGLGALDGSHPAVDRVLAALATDGPDRADLAVPIATVELLRGDAKGYDRVVRWLGEHDVTDLGVAARFLRLVLRLFREEREDGIAVVPALPPAWRGQGFEAHGLPLQSGNSLAYAVRWHGPRPALLWELGVPEGAGVPPLTSGIDPTWRTVEARGEALLVAPADAPGRPPSVAGGEPPSFA